MFEQEVAKGASYLDKTNPGWENQIDLESLNLQNCKVCILGQLDSDFWKEIKRRNMSFSEAAEYGFAVDTNIGNYERWRYLTEEWRNMIVTRRRNYKSKIRKFFNKLLH